VTTTVVDADLDQIVRVIWGSFLELPLATATDPLAGGVPTVTSVVNIDGAWRGAVMMQFPSDLAVTVTAAIFQADTEPDQHDVGDALGELANMVAGNVKALLPEPCGISLPTVAFGPDYQLSVVGTEPVASATFTCEGRPFVVTLLQRSEGAGREH
jgi:CheY-specific phosphatase CheX